MNDIIHVYQCIRTIVKVNCFILIQFIALFVVQIRYICTTVF